MSDRVLTKSRTNEEFEFIQMISEKTGLSLGEATRLAINMFRVILGLETVDVDKVGRALREASERVIRDALWLNSYFA